MTIETTYNHEVLTLALAGLSALTLSASQHKSVRTPAQESHFLCNWMVESLKGKKFSKLVADDLTAWIRQARSQGAGAQLKNLLERIVYQYQTANAVTVDFDVRLNAFIAELTEQKWVVITDSVVNEKLKLDSDGQSSLIISAKELSDHIKLGKITKAISLYVRGNEDFIATTSLKHGLLLSQGNKKTSLIKHHKNYQLMPKNQHAKLCLLNATLAS